MTENAHRVREILETRYAEYLEIATKYESAFGECHPVGFIGVVSALYYGKQNRQHILSTDSVSAIFGQRNNDNQHMYDWLSRGAENGEKIIKRCGQDELFQTWQLTDYSYDLKLPELSMLLASWMNQNFNQVDVKRFLEFQHVGLSKIDSNFIQILYLTTLFGMTDNVGLPDNVNKFLNAQVNVFKEIDPEMLNDDRKNMRKSLLKSGMIKRSGQSNKYIYSLTDGGVQFVRDVVIPFSALLLDEDEFRSNPIFEKYNRLLMMPIGTYFQDRKDAKLVLEELGTKIAQK